MGRQYGQIGKIAFSVRQAPGERVRRRVGGDRRDETLKLETSHS
jgi:hypothetical protein